MSVWFEYRIGLQVMQLSSKPTSIPKSEDQIIVVELL